MKISLKDVELYYQLMSHLMRFSHDFKALYPGREFGKDVHLELTQEEVLELRGAIYDDPEKISAYVAENPDQLNSEHLAIIDSWRFALRGDFYIERYLKNHAIFIHNVKAYAVQALFDDFDEFFPKNVLPIRVNTVLLPFKGGIIYDGQMRAYRMHFGGGIKRTLKDEYMTAKRNNAIIHSLNPADQKTINKQVNKKPEKDWSKELAQLNAIAKKMKGGQGQPEAYGAVFSLLRASIELAEMTIVEDQDYSAIRKGVQKANRAINRFVNSV